MHHQRFHIACQPPTAVRRRTNLRLSAWRGEEGGRSGEGPGYMAAARLWHKAALVASWAPTAGAGHSAAARSKCVAASLSSAAERGPTSQARHRPASTSARIWLATRSSGAALTTLADSALSPSSFHHSGLATSAHASCLSMSKAAAVASAQPSEPTG